VIEYTAQVLVKLKNKFPQYSLNGTNNIWIVKPGQKSRGRGIEVFTKYEDIIQFIKTAKGRQVV
jgi:tubulin monoglycylase TTLL3/8